jgi:Ca2+-binding RTX toxin-like protein
MKKALLIIFAAVLALPASASAATATADVERRQGTIFGPVTFKAAKGEVNRVSVRVLNGRLRFHDNLNRVRAKGDCDQAGANTAICPFTEDIARVRLGNRDDRARAEGFVEVLGGSGADVLRGSRSVDMLNGQKGNDFLRGGRGDDDLTGGPGRDNVGGGRGDDDLIDGETDRNATRDVYRGSSSRDTAGSDRGDQVFYTKRNRGIDIDFLRGKIMKGPGSDELIGIESVAGGSGDDKLAGDGDDNLLEGNGGNDRIRGRNGDDIPMGGPGDDAVFGDDGEDVVWGNGGKDFLNGGSGDDLMDADDSNAEQVLCGTGADIARVTRLDRVRRCEIATKGSLYVRVRPTISGDEATFAVACQQLGGCSGTLTLTSDGEAFGSGSFTNLPDDPQTFSDVTVDLTPAAVAALEEGVGVQVAFGDEGGYLTSMRAP